MDVDHHGQCIGDLAPEFKTAPTISRSRSTNIWTPMAVANTRALSPQLLALSGSPQSRNGRK
jgi:hypothetical protein